MNDFIDRTMRKITDKERLDFLQKLNDKVEFTGFCCLRNSTTGRGWRLHETEFPTDSHQAFSNVRDAIDYQIRSGSLLSTKEVE